MPANMKRKFSFNLAPIKVPTKAETKALKESLATRDISTPASPYINRRILSPKTEAELRAACESILSQDDNSYGQAAALQAAESKMDFQALHHSMKTMQAERAYKWNGNHQSTNTAPRREASGPGAAIAPSNKFAYKPDTALRDLFPEGDSTHRSVQANTSRRRDYQSILYDTRSTSHKAPVKRSEQYPDQTTPQSATTEKPGTLSRNRDSESPETNHSTPLSASTDNHHHYTSTAITSAELPSQNSKRNSHYICSDEDAAHRADAEAMHWMKLEYERSRREDGQPRPSSRTSRAASVTKSIKSELKEYFRPSSLGLSRSTSRDSLRSGSSEASNTHAVPTHGWRSWSLQRKPSGDSLDSRSGSIRGRNDNRNREGKKEVNLNRELPPLPGLDQWKESEQEAERDSVSFSKPTSPTHIANLMQAQPKVRSRRNQSSQQGPSDRTQRRHDARSRTASSQHTSDSDVPMHFQPRSGDSLTQDLAMSHVDFDNLLSAMRYTRHQDETTKRNASIGDSGHGGKEPYNARLLSMNTSLEEYRDEAPNFNKKISMDRQKRNQDVDARYKHVVELRSDDAPSNGSVHNATGLKKMFGNLGLGRHKKSETWMDKFEKNRIKGGVMIQEEAAGAPVVRY